MSIDLTGVATSVIGAFLSIVLAVFLAWLQSHMKDQTAAATIGAAVKNAVGAVQQAADAGLTSHPLQYKLPPGTPAATAAGVQYVLDHAGPELMRFSGVTLSAVTDKVEAQLGLAKLAAPAIAQTGGAQIAAQQAMATLVVDHTAAAHP